MKVPKVLAALLCSLLFPGSLLASSPELALNPAFAMLSPGQEFFVEVTVPAAGKEFNAFSLQIQFPPTRVEFVPGSQQVGALVTSSCGNRFHRFTPSSDHLDIDVSLLCANRFMTGPGVLYRVKFRALPTAGPTLVVFSSELFRAGIALPAGNNEGSSLCVSNCITEVGGPAGIDRLEFAAPAPNPRRGDEVGTLRFRLPANDAVGFDLLDTRGRVVARREPVEMSAGPQQITWSLPRLAAGIYYARVRTAHGLVATRSWVILR